MYLIGDSRLKNTRQHSIGKVTKCKVKCFPGARLQGTKHCSVPALSVKLKHIIVRCGTNDLKSNRPDEIVKETNELCHMQPISRESPDACPLYGWCPQYNRLNLLFYLTNTADLQVKNYASCYKRRVLNLTSIFSKRNKKDNQGSSTVNEVNNVLKSLCMENNFRFLSHQNTD